MTTPPSTPFAPSILFWSTPLAALVYPFSTRVRWLVSSRYAHIARAVEDRMPADSLVQERITALERWNRVRAVVTGLLSLGIIAAVASYFGDLNPSLGETASLLQQASAISGAFTGLLTLAYLFLTRLLSQIEADVLMLIGLDQ